MTKTKTLFLILPALFLGTLSLGNEESFETRKAEALKRIEERLAKLTEHRNCVANSNSREQLKACHEKIRRGLQSQKEDRMEMRKDRMEKRKERMEKRKSK